NAKEVMKTRARGGRDTANLAGQTFALAGLRAADRQMLIPRIEGAGGTVVADVAESLNFLVIPKMGVNPPTPAEKKARRLIQQGAALRILTPRQVVKLLMPAPEQVLAMLLAGPKGIARWNAISESY